MSVWQGNDLFLSIVCERLRPTKELQKLLRNLLFSKCFSLFVLPFFLLLIFFLLIFFFLYVFCSSFLLASFDVMHVQIILLIYAILLQKCSTFFLKVSIFPVSLLPFALFICDFLFLFSFCHYLIFSFSFFYIILNLTYSYTNFFEIYSPLSSLANILNFINRLLNPHF